jgi:hypothetical protein
MNKKLTILAVLGVTLSMSSAAMAVTTVSNTMTVSATVTGGCTVSAAAMTFPAISAFADTDVIADTSESLMIACSAGTTPLLWSDTDRVLAGPGVGGIVEIPFSLGQTTATALTNALPVLTGEAIAADFVANGTAQAVPLHGLIKAADYLGKEPGVYSASIAINVNY